MVPQRSNLPHTAYALAVLFALAAVPALQFDLAVLNWLRQGKIPSDLRRLIVWSEIFAHGAGIAIILLTVVVLDPSHRRGFARLLACVFTPGVAANVIKLIVPRSRPRDLRFDSVWDSFQGWIPAISTGDLCQAFNSSIQSFPSGHATTATGLAVGLCLFYPRGRWLFIALAAMACFQRLYANAHFLSDTLVGAAIGCLIAGLCCDPHRLGAWFDRIEQTNREPEA